MLYSFFRFIISIFLHLFFNIQLVRKPEKKAGRLIISANHLSAWDPLILAITSPYQLSFVAKKELSENPILHFLLKQFHTIFVDREEGDLVAIKTMIQSLEEGKKVCIFPEGTRVKEVDFDNMKMGTSFLALKASADIQVVTLKSDYSFRSKVEVYYHPLISIENYQNLKGRKARESLSKEIFKKMYPEYLEKEENENHKK